MKKDITERLRGGEKVLGTFFELGSATAVECLGLAGLDFCIIDTEHGPFDVESTLDYVRAAERRGIAPFVRIKDATRPSVLKMLDIGAKALIIPCINSVDEVKKLVEYGKYHPVGLRGFAPARAAAFGEDFPTDLSEYFAAVNRSTMIIPQCETANCLAQIEEIAALDGVDGIFVGPYDLSISLGKPGQVSDPVVAGAIAHVLKVCKAAGKKVFIYAGTGEGARKCFQDGFDGVAYNMDTCVYINAFKSVVKEIMAD